MTPDQERRLVFNRNPLVISYLIGGMDAGGNRICDVIAQLKSTLLAFPPKVGTAITLQPRLVLIKQVTIAHLTDLASIALVDHLNSTAAEVADLVWSKVLWTKFARIGHLVVNEILQLPFSMLEDLVDGLKRFALFEQAVIVLFEDLADAVDRVEKLIYDCIKIAGSEGVRIVEGDAPGSDN